MSLQRLFHWGPFVTLLIINWVSLATIYSAILLWSPFSVLSGIGLLIFIVLGVLTTYHFISAILIGPGFLTKGWTPVEASDGQYLQYCSFCQGFKAPRSHHCRKCGACVLKMDHHCPWINSCVGHLNHGHFISFLFFAILGSAQSLFILILGLYYGVNRAWFRYYGTGDEPIVILSIWSLLFIMLAVGLAVGVVLAVGALFIFQLKAVLRNQTGIEDWILEKANYRLKDGTVFKHPYSLGAWNNFKQVFSLSCTPQSDGIEDWPLAPGSQKYDLTREQLIQKAEKRARMREYFIATPYSGAICPIRSMGLRISLFLPLTDEPRIPLNKGDRIRVSRWKKHWLYGDKVTDGSNSQRIRGWFPRKCASDMLMSNSKKYVQSLTDSIPQDSKKDA